MSGSNHPGGASPETAAEWAIIERRTIPRIFVSERTLESSLLMFRIAARKECSGWS